MTLDLFLPELRDVLLSSVDGVQAAYTFDDLPPKLTALPAWVVLPKSGSQEFGGANIALYDIQAILYHSPANVAQAWAFLVRAVDPVRKAIGRNLTLGGIVSYCHPVPPPATFFEIGALSSIYGDQVFIGCVFNLQVKEISNLEIQ